ncbi:MAG: methyltetrahydrofolate:corrinoid methyltransferase [Planctomycetes bacterium DG_23]|nr:MAG: methyltetrahydrofolate:corrinoid methyltransferase [Planctomycetes bacterium DG_23]
MLIVGERINGTREEIARAISERDGEFIRNEARTQVDAAAAMLDVNAGTTPKTEAEDLKWLVEVVQGEVDVPLAIDSANPEALAAGLSVHKGSALINSITAEEERFRAVLPLIKEFDASVVALTMAGGIMPESAEGRLAIAQDLIQRFAVAGIPQEKIYFDPLVRPVATESAQGRAVLEAVRQIKEKFPEARTICGLSNISFGLPRRGLLNRTFLAMLLASGLDAAIIDPTDKRMMAAIFASRSLLGQDEYSLKYIDAQRKGLLK